jgi:hypothetical protein
VLQDRNTQRVPPQDRRGMLVVPRGMLVVPRGILAGPQYQAWVMQQLQAQWPVT